MIITSRELSTPDTFDTSLPQTTLHIMSDVAENSQPARVKAPRNRGPKRSGGRGGGRARPTEDTKGSDEEPAQPRETIMSPSVPKSMIGTTVTGKICDIVKRGRGQFGFILIGEGSRSETPRIYFSFKDYTEANYPPRRSYLVEFECSEDDSERAFASNVRLTAEGLKEASERDAKYQANSETKKEPTGERRVRRPRKDVGEGRTVVLKVTCEGMTETKQVTANVTQSIGKIANLFASVNANMIKIYCLRARTNNLIDCFTYGCFL